MATTATATHATVKRTDSAARARARTVRTAYLYILPAAVVMLVMTSFPLIYQLWMSLTNYSNLNLRTSNLLGQMVATFNASQRQAYNSPSFVGLDNYVLIVSNQLGQLLSQFDFWRILIFNLVWTFSNVALHVAIGVAIAVLLNTPGLWFKPLYRALYILPWAIPGLVASMVWRNLFDSQSGIINILLAGLGFARDIRWWEQVDPPIPFLPLLPLSFYAALVANVWLGWPFMMTIASGALQGIPKELYEAAAVDGASPWKRFWAITVPLLRPAMVPAIMIGMMWTFNQ